MLGRTGLAGLWQTTFASPKWNQICGPVNDVCWNGCIHVIDRYSMAPSYVVVRGKHKRMILCS